MTEKTSSLISADMERHQIPARNRFIKWLKLLSIPGCRYMFLFRMANNRGGGFWWKMVMRHYSIKYGIQIPLGTQIGPGFYIGHFGNIVINHQCIIGSHCNIAQGATLGSSNRGSRMGCPHIGNRVWIGTNAVIVGKIVIGDDVLIAPNSYVTQDVPAHSIVMGNPAVIKSRENATEGYL